MLKRLTLSPNKSPDENSIVLNTHTFGEKQARRGQRQGWKAKNFELNMIEIIFTHNMHICPENCVMVRFDSIRFGMHLFVWFLVLLVCAIVVGLACWWRYWCEGICGHTCLVRLLACLLAHTFVHWLVHFNTSSTSTADDFALSGEWMV